VRDESRLHQLRQIPGEWHRRGMTSPAELDAIIEARLGEPFGIHSAAEPSYADFFAAPAAA
jgi:hypothetical protein